MARRGFSGWTPASEPKTIPGIRAISVCPGDSEAFKNATFGTAINLHDLCIKVYGVPIWLLSGGWREYSGADWGKKEDE